jgi:hypothetical protein
VAGDVTDEMKEVQFVGKEALYQPGIIVGKVVAIIAAPLDMAVKPTVFAEVHIIQWQLVTNCISGRFDRAMGTSTSTALPQVGDLCALKEDGNSNTGKYKMSAIIM